MTKPRLQKTEDRKERGKLKNDGESSIAAETHQAKDLRNRCGQEARGAILHDRPDESQFLSICFVETAKAVSTQVDP